MRLMVLMWPNVRFQPRTALGRVGCKPLLDGLPNAPKSAVMQRSRRRYPRLTAATRFRKGDTDDHGESIPKNADYYHARTEEPAYFLREQDED